MTATHTAYKTNTRPRRSRRLPRLGWGWAGLAIVAIGIARTWPYWTAAAVTLLAAAVIVRAIRPRRLARLWTLLDRIKARRRSLPAHGRTLETFQRMHPTQFEHAIAELAAEHPTVHRAHVVGGANDRGADVLIDLNDGRRILIQCKRYRNGNNVTSEDVQKTNGTYRDIHRCHAAAIVTTARFTRSAIETNAMLPQQIRLIDGGSLVLWANGGPTPWQ
ncbi:restriction endonuclease [Streptomyces sp. AS02]|uniref:restriction endonuclease n=1 Tax=Streptomyces sp. AS02 TaxID=2938946 RepID=UPI0020225D73|nr:restriction endonuclease [Streptomyces sp. AS02]MCL8016857.1 restriction endonuclease [Streptomyces sp. AS02]